MSDLEVPETAAAILGSGRPIVPTMLSCLLMLMSATRAPADDVVIWKSEEARRTTRTTGEIVDFNGDRLLLRHAGDREQAIAARLVIRVESPRSRVHQDADELFQQRQYQNALEKYREAEGQEKRAWMARRIQAQIVWCQRNLGLLQDALGTFLVLLHADPTLQFLDAAPMMWVTEPLTPNAERQAQELLTGRSVPAGQPTSDAQVNLQSVAKLIAASWLLPTAQRSTAIQTLTELATSPDDRIASWAEGQSWRIQLVTASAETVQKWQSRWTHFPTNQQAGPALVLGQALARHQQHQDAVLMLLRSPLLAPHDIQLNPHALLAAGRELETMGSPAEANTLYQEILDRYPASSLIPLARERLEKLQVP